jgi:excisionase family DNA binding protein
MAFASMLQDQPEVSSFTGEVLIPREAAEFMRCGLSTLRRWTSEGRIPVHTIAGRPRYIKAELLATLEARLLN